MTDLLQRELLMVAGKGGVGKTTVTAALGLLGQRAGRSTALVEMAGTSSLAGMFPGTEIGYEGTTVGPGLRAFSISAKQSVEEYLLRHIRIRALYDLVFGNRFIAPFMNAVLGLSDLISLGKVMDLGWEVDDEGKRRYQLLVVDSPATGHGLTMLRAPQAMMDIARKGPLFQNAQLVRDLLADPERSALILVTLPEEMPVNETIQMAEAVESSKLIRLAAVVVNGVPQTPFPPDEERAFRALVEGRDARVGGEAGRALREANRMLWRRGLAQRHIDRLRRSIPVPLVEVPRMPSRAIHGETLEALARHLEALP